MILGHWCALCEVLNYRVGLTRSAVPCRKNQSAVFSNSHEVASTGTAIATCLRQIARHRIDLFCSFCTTPKIDPLPYNSGNRERHRQKFRKTRELGCVMFQDDDQLSPPSTNRRVSNYISEMEQQRGYAPIDVSGGVAVYSKG